jgi:hypothetical protein
MVVTYQNNLIIWFTTFLNDFIQFEIVKIEIELWEYTAQE